MRKFYTIVGVLLLLLVAPKTSAQVWEAVGNAYGISEANASYIDIACNSSNNYYVSYYDANVMKGSVKRMYRSTWSYVGGKAGITDGIAMATSMAIDASDTPYFLYRDAEDNYRIAVKKYVDDDWVDIAYASEKLVTGFTAKFSKKDQLFVAMKESDSYGTVKKLDGDTWVTIGDTLASASPWPYSLDIAITNDDTAYVCFNAGGYVHVYKNSINADINSEWIPVGTDNIDVATNVAFCNTNLEMDADENLYLQYYNGSNVTVRKFDGTTWNVLGQENILPDNGASHFSMVVTDDGKPYVAATYTNTYVMTYDTESDAWEKVGVNTVSVGQGLFNKLMIDQNGDIVIVFNEGYYNKIVVKKLNNDLVAVEGVEIVPEDGGEAIIDVDNGSLQLAANITPANASELSVEWSIVSGSNKASISKDGLLTATTSNGSVIVKAASLQNLAVYDTITVEITNQFSDVIPESASLEILNDGTTDMLAIGETIALAATILPEEADQYVVWSIVDGSDFVSVDNYGVVTGLTEGFATIRATTLSQDTVYAEMNVAVFEKGYATGVDYDSDLNGYNITAGTGLASADDFIIEEGKAFEIKKARFVVWAYNDFEIENVDINIYASENDTTPGRVLNSIVGLTPANQIPTGTSYQKIIEVNLEESFTLTEGRYWIGFEVTSNNSTTVYWDLTFDQDLGYPFRINESGWETFGDPGWDAEFNVIGNYGESGHDVKLNSISSSITRMIPAKQCSGEKTFQVEVENQGNEAEEATITVSQGETSYFTEAVSLAVDEVKSMEVTIDLGDCEAGMDFNLLFKIEAAEDDNMLNNTDTLSFSVTDSTYVTDYEDVPNASHGVGSNSFQIYLGNIFELFVEDTITSVDMMFIDYEAAASKEFSFNIFEVSDDDTIDINSPVLQEVFVRGVGGEATTFMVYPTVLKPGRYYFAMQQLDAFNIGLNHDYDGRNYSVLVYNDKYLGAYSALGAPHIRPNFGTTAYTSTGVSDINAGSTRLELYPNPVADNLTIRSVENISHVSIYNNVGALVQSVTANATELSINTTEMIPGMYYVKVSTASEESVIKLIKK